MVRFAGDRKFHDEVERRVLAYFESTGRPQKADTAMVVKTSVLLAWLVLSYVLLVFVTLRQALASHGRWLRRMGRAPALRPIAA